MNENLLEINRLLKSIAHCHDYRYVDSDEYEKIMQMMHDKKVEELETWQKNCRDTKVYETEQKAQQLWDSIKSELTPQEIVTGYQIGCIELKGWLGGIIYHRMLIRMQTDESQLKRYPVESVKAIKLAPENEFQIYAETMIEAIKNDDPISYLFMGALYHYMKLDDFRKIILIALNQRNRRTLDTAMAFAEQSGMKEAIPLIERLTTHPNDRLRGIAIKALETLMEK